MLRLLYVTLVAKLFVVSTRFNFKTQVICVLKFTIVFPNTRIGKTRASDFWNGHLYWAAGHLKWVFNELYKTLILKDTTSHLYCIRNANSNKFIFISFSYILYIIKKPRSFRGSNCWLENTHVTLIFTIHEEHLLVIHT